MSGFLRFVALVGLVVGGLVLFRRPMPSIGLRARKHGAALLGASLLLFGVSGSLAPQSTEATDSALETTPAATPIALEPFTSIQEEPVAPSPAAPSQVFVSPPTAPVVKPPAPAPKPPPPAFVAPPPANPPPANPPPPPAVAGSVHPGAFCSGGGATGVTNTGKPMVCKTSATDDRLRWRAA